MAADTGDGHTGSDRRDRTLFLVATFFYWASLYLYVPILPVYAESVVGSLTLVGVVISSYAVPQLLLRIPLGLRFDAVTRRKPLVVASLAMCVVGALGLGGADDVWLLSLARGATGVAAAGWVAFSVFFASYSSRAGAARSIGTINSVNQVAQVAATGSGGLIADALGYGATFYGAALLALLGIAALAPAREPRGETRLESGAVQFKRVALRPLLIAGAGMSILLQFASFASVFGFVPVYGASIGAAAANWASSRWRRSRRPRCAYSSVRLAERFGYSAALVAGALVMSCALFSFRCRRSRRSSRRADGEWVRPWQSQHPADGSRLTFGAARRQATAMASISSLLVRMLAGTADLRRDRESWNLDVVFRQCGILTLVLALRPAPACAGRRNAA
jgi:MFS family permease